MVAHEALPERVALAYRVVGEGKTHVFTAVGIKGLVHVGSHDLREAFEKVMPALSEHISVAYGCEAAYRCDTSFDDFYRELGTEDSLSAGVLTFTLAKNQLHA